MSGLITELLAEAPVLLDGAWGTQLQARGLPPGDCADEWNLLRPELVEDVARAYVDAGSRIILTNTFRSNRIALARTALADKIVSLNRAGVEISRRAAQGRARVFASIGPSGKLLLMEQVTPDELRASFAEQAEALATAGADALVVETMSDIQEATLAVEAARRTGLPVVASMVFDSGKEHDRTMTGATPEQVARALTDAGADVIGANCGQGIRGFIPVCRRLRTATDRPLWIKANAGLPVVEEDHIVYRTSAEEFAASVPALVAAGATFIGGCCGTTPDFIRAMARILKP